MRRPLRKLLRVLVYTGATLIILLAVLVGLFRLLLPQLPEYQLEIKQRVGQAVGMQVEFAGLDARWRFSGPELLFDAVSLADPDSGDALLQAEEVVVGASLLRLVRERRVSINRVVVRGSRLHVERMPDGTVTIEGRALRDLLPAGEGDTRPPTDLRVEAEDVLLVYSDERARKQRSEFVVDRLEFRRRADDDSIEVSVRPAGSDGAAVMLGANRRDRRENQTWSLFFEAQELGLEPYLAVLPRDLPLPDSASGSLSVWVDIVDGTVAHSNANIDLAGIRFAATEGEAELSADITGKVDWTFDANSAVTDFDLDTLAINGNEWRPTSGRVELQLADGHATGVRASARYLDIRDLWALHQWLPEGWRGDLPELDPAGSLQSLNLELDGLGTAAVSYRIDTDFDDIGIAATESLPGLNGLRGTLSATTDAGRLQISTGSLTVSDPRLFSAPLLFDGATGGISWRKGSRGLSILGDQLKLASSTFNADGNFEVLVPSTDASASIELDMRYSVHDVAGIHTYLPDRKMKDRMYKWFVDALVAGRVVDGTLSMSGPLDEFPFDNEERGYLRATGQARDVTLRFSGPWPAAEIEYADVVVDGLQLYSRSNRGGSLGSRGENVEIEIPDLRDGKLQIASRVQTTLPNLLRYVWESPLGEILGPKVRDVRGEGAIGVEFELYYPINDRDAFAVEVVLTAEDASASLLPLRQKLTGISGQARIDRTAVNASGIRAELLGSPVEIELLPAASETGYRTLAIVSGAVTADALQKEFDTRMLGAMSGSTNYRATVRFPRSGIDEAPPLTIRVESDLEGLGVQLPMPLTKPADALLSLQLDTEFPSPGTIAVDATLGEGIDAALLFDATGDDERWRFARGNVHAGPGAAVLPVGSGLFIDGSVNALRLSDWLEYIDSLQLTPGNDPLLRGIDLRIATAYAYGQMVSDLSVQLDRSASEWLVQLESQRVAGSVFVPLDLDAGRPVVLQMDRMLLTEPDPETGEPGDPRHYPPVEARAESFAFGRRSFGALEASVQKSADGLVLSTLATNAPSFTSTGGGSWEVLPDGQQISRLNAIINSTDTAETSRSLDIDSSIAADSAVATFDVSWQGPPRDDFFESLDGVFSIEIANGRLDEVEPGAGRVLGLMSVIELPRRLALDFRDVFSKGFSFNLIQGDYRIVNGEALTCNLSLEGPAADIALIGRVGLVRRDYNQTAVVNANFGNSLPAVGALAAGPQGAAAMLVLSRIFKKPLQGISQAYYQINGSWDDPSIERTTVERFNATSQLADCLQSLP